MSKLKKLIKSPGAFFVDAIKKRNPNSAKSTPAKKPAAGAKKPLAQSATPIAAQNKMKHTGQLDLLKNMLMEGEYTVVKKAWNVASESNRSTAELSGFLNIRAESELAQARHDELMETGHQMVTQYNSYLGHYYRAQSLFVRGLYTEALHELQNLMRRAPNHADSVYLACEIFERFEDYETAWQLLENLALVSKRNKTWHVMANLCHTDADIFRLLRNWKNWKVNKVGPAFHQDVSEFIALGALRVGNFELGRSIWRETLFSAAAKKGGFTSIKKRIPSYSSKRAEAALSDLNRVFSDAGVDMFLVSGTLLGCVREGRLLGHDKDIDIGIWSKVPEEKVLELATTSGLFYVLKSRSKEIIRLRHVNGIPIDVFYHFKEKKDYWHGGVKMVWHNTPFKLVKYEFLGEEYLIPENYDLYLQENYGDWRTPMIAFDSAFDTPNGEVKSDQEMAIHSFKGLLASCVSEQWGMADLYLQKLEEFGEVEFIDKFQTTLTKIPSYTKAKEAEAAEEELKNSYEAEHSDQAEHAEQNSLEIKQS